MEQHIKTIWKTFKQHQNEAFYLFYETSSGLQSCKISMNETATSGEIDVIKLRSQLSVLSGQHVWGIHNHPNDLPTPSYPDFFQKNYLHSLLTLCNIQLTDYGIVSPYGYISFVENGLFSPPPFEPYQPSEIHSLSCPSCVTSHDIMEQETFFLQALAKTPEIFYTPHKQYGATTFSGSFLIDQQQELLGNHVLFFGKDIKTHQTRLRHLDCVMEPFEIYGIHQGRLTPLKLYGFL